MRRPGFIVVLDAGDDAALTHAALRAHDPRRGVLTVHPTPATTAASALAHDFLAALGRPITDLGEAAAAGLRPAWSAVTGWIVGDGIGQILVLRAHLFREAQWQHLIELHEATGTAMLVFCHSAAVPKPARPALAQIPHIVTADHDKAVRLLAAAVAGHQRPPDSDITPVGPLPQVPRSPVHHFRADAWRQLPGEQFAVVDAQYRHGLEQACTWWCGNSRTSTR